MRKRRTGLKSKYAAGVRICERGRTEKRPSLKVNGDLYTSNKIYRESLNFALSWEPEKRLKDFVDLYVPSFHINIKQENIEVTLYYPRDFQELAEFILGMYNVPRRQKSTIFKSNDLNILLRIIHNAK